VQFSSHCHFHKLSCSCFLGSAAAPAGHHVYLQFKWEVGLPSSPVEFFSLLHSHKLPRSWLLGARPAPARGSPACPACLFTVPGRVPFPQSSALRAPHPLSSILTVLIAYYSVSLFFPRWRSVCPGGYAALAQACLWGVPWYHEAHLVRVFPSHMGAGHWWPWGPSLFLCLT
jgi:hypothetical protein